ncbi:MAG: DEAD/DEAH box helicase, partial [Bacteroidota bacterium]
MSFSNLNLITPLLEVLNELKYSKPTPVQEQSIPIVLAGRDIFGCAQTGTGKTAAFALPILQHISLKKQKPGNHIKALVLAPTRELALQIGQSFSEYGRKLPYRNVVLFGGVSQVNQTNALKNGVDILIATPGRLLDLLDRNALSLQD